MQTPDLVAFQILNHDSLLNSKTEGHLMTGYIEGIGKKHRDFNWTYIQSGLAGGAYFRTAAVLDAFSDAAIASLNWTSVA